MSATSIVSVLMTSYNREKYIAAAIESVLKSTLTDFELIVCDDCSIDRTVEIVKSYVKKDSRVKLFINEKNLGDYPNRNQAASYANGKYLKYVDADDHIYPWGLQLLVEMMEAHPEAGWGLCSLEQDVRQPFPFVLDSKSAYMYHYNGPGLFHKAPLSSIIRSEAFTSINGFSPIRMAGDYDMWHKLAKEYKVLLMPHGIVWYREHSEQEMNQYEKFSFVYDEVTVNHLKDKSVPLSKEETRKIINNITNGLLKKSFKFFVRLRFSKAVKEFKRYRFYANKK